MIAMWNTLLMVEKSKSLMSSRVVSSMADAILMVFIKRLKQKKVLLLKPTRKPMQQSLFKIISVYIANSRV
jgi:hypothetical protein